jgi:hypothetical protein
LIDSSFITASHPKRKCLPIFVSPVLSMWCKANNSEDSAQNHGHRHNCVSAMRFTCASVLSSIGAQQSLLVQVGQLDPARLPVAGVELARKLLSVAHA